MHAYLDLDLDLDLALGLRRGCERKPGLQSHAPGAEICVGTGCQLP